MDATERYNLVDRFLRNELNDSELQHFNEALESDSLLQQELADQKMLSEIIFSSEIKEIQNQVKADVDQLLTKKPSGKWYTASLVILGITAVGLLLYPSEKTHKIADNQESKTPETEIKESSINSTKATTTPAIATTSEEIISNKAEETVPSDEIEKSITATTESQKEEGGQKNEATSVPLSSSNEATPTVDEPETTKIVATTAPTTENKCPHETLNFSVKVKHEHNGKYDGKISVSSASIEGVQEPVQYLLTELSNSFGDESNFNGLTSGSYHLKVQDANGCIIENQSLIEIKQLYCNETTEHLLNMQYDESINISLITPATAIQVRDKTGTLVWESNDFADEKYSWNGRNNNGVVVLNGLYLYQINNENNSTCSGSITVLKN